MSAAFAIDDIVRPNAEAIALTRFRETSRLRVRGVQKGARCRACFQVARRERPNFGPVGWHRASTIERGSLYAAGSEPSSNLCLDHVESLDV